LTCPHSPAMGLLYLAAVSCLLSTSCLAASVNGEDAVGVTMCCPPGKTLKVTDPSPYNPYYSARCVRSRITPNATLDGMKIPVASDDVGNSDYEDVEPSMEMLIKKTGVMLPSCKQGLIIKQVSLKKSGSGSSRSGNETSSSSRSSSKRVRLGDYYCGHSNCNKGNVYVDDKPVCDDEWDDTDAEVVCRELGFDGGYATTESKYGSVDLNTQACFDQVRCRGSESSLVNCRHESQDDCGDSEGAGVVCYGGQDHDSDGDGVWDEEDSDNDNDGIADSEQYGYNYPGPGASADDTGAILLSKSGQLTIKADTDRYGGSTNVQTTTYKSGEFCLAEDLEDDEQAKALVCDSCMSKVLCANIMELFKSLSYSGSRSSRSERFVLSLGDGEGPRRNDDMIRNIILVADTEGDEKVTFDEFNAKINSYVKEVFGFLDANGDDSLEIALKEASVKKINLKILLDILHNLMTFFDVNEDDILSVEDAPERTFRDRNDDGKINLREVFGTSPINLPAPLYRLYTLLDRNKNEKLSFEEATNFIKGTFYVIDQNEDCFIDLDEFIATLSEKTLPKEYQIAVKLIGDQYFTLLDFALELIITAADKDGDKKTTLAEIIDMDNPDFISTIVKVATNMGMPNMKAVYFLLGEERRYGSRDKQGAVVEMWLNVLYDFVDSRKYGQVPKTMCGIE